ncbi:hypothetical protein [Amycolatopsis magusensis]|uniref:hypothetical protein n=1 Tax=Amycolatopsis magusensis TaxID=882444 RepID=UPI003C2BA255
MDSEKDPVADEAVVKTAPRPRDRTRPLLLGAAALATAAFLAAAIFGIQWWVAAAGDDAELAQARDEVLVAGTAAVKAFTEFDYTNLDQYFQKQQELSTGAIQEQARNSEGKFREAIGQAQTVVVTTVQDIAVEELNEHEGKATCLVALSTDVTKGAEKGVKSLRVEIEMTRVGDEWKLSSIGNVPVVGAGQQ